MTLNGSFKLTEYPWGLGLSPSHGYGANTQEVEQIAECGPLGSQQARLWTQPFWYQIPSLSQHSIMRIRWGCYYTNNLDPPQIGPNPLWNQVPSPPWRVSRCVSMLPTLSSPYLMLPEHLHSFLKVLLIVDSPPHGHCPQGLLVEQRRWGPWDCKTTPLFSLWCYHFTLWSSGFLYKILLKESHLLLIHPSPTHMHICKSLSSANSSKLLSKNLRTWR